MNHDGNHQPAQHERNIGIAVLVLLLIGCFAVLRPFFSALLWAIVLSFAVWPAQRRLSAWLRGRRSLAATLIILTIAAALVVPLMVTVANLADDARALGNAGHRWLETGMPASPAWVATVPLIGPRAARYWDEVAAELSTFARGLASSDAPAPTSAPAEQSKLLQTARTLLGWARTWLLAFGLAIGQGVMQVALSLLILFFILKHGETLAMRLSRMIFRISGQRGVQLLDVAGGTVRGVIYGILGTALAQGVMAGVGFLVAGVPGATLLGLVTFLVSVVPMGPPLVWIPAAIWLFRQGQTGWGVFMLIWGAGVSSVDNIIKPWLISRGSKMPFIVIFFGVLGGALAFGLIGVFIGPTLLAVAYRLIDEWSGRQVAADAPSPSAAAGPSRVG